MQELLECLKSMKNFKTSHLSILDLVDERQLAAEQDVLDEEEERVQRFAGWLSEENRQGVACGFNTIITIAHVTSFCTRTPKVTRLFLVESLSALGCQPCQDFTTIYGYRESEVASQTA